MTFIHFIIGHIDRESLHDTRGVQGIGDHPFIHILNIVDIKLSLLQTTFIFIVI